MAAISKKEIAGFVAGDWKTRFRNPGMTMTLPAAAKPASKVDDKTDEQNEPNGAAAKCRTTQIKAATSKQQEQHK